MKPCLYRVRHTQLIWAVLARLLLKLVPRNSFNFDYVLHVKRIKFQIQ